MKKFIRYIKEIYNGKRNIRLEIKFLRKNLRRKKYKKLFFHFLEYDFNLILKEKGETELKKALERAVYERINYLQSKLKQNE